MYVYVNIYIYIYTYMCTYVCTCVFGYCSAYIYLLLCRRWPRGIASPGSHPADGERQGVVRDVVRGGCTEVVRGCSGAYLAAGATMGLHKGVVRQVVQRLFGLGSQ